MQETYRKTKKPKRYQDREERSNLQRSLRDMLNYMQWQFYAMVIMAMLLFALVLLTWLYLP